MSETLSTTPLHAQHLSLGGRMVPFAGYDMPVQYTSILAESAAVRHGAGMFDVSHMARLELSGPEVETFLLRVTANDVTKLTREVGQYSLLPNERGGTVDDIIVYKLDDQRYRMVVNASNHAKDVAWLRQHNAEGVSIDDHTSETAMIAVQGPKAVGILASLASDSGTLEGRPAFGVYEGSIAGVEVFAARSGYTGEDGFELICHAEHASKLWTALLDAGVVACGLGSRDTLRVEAGLPLYGHELTDDLSPIAAGLGWVIRKTGGYLGADHIEKVRAEGAPRTLKGVRLQSRRLIEPGMKVFVEDSEVGEVSSGVVSPLLGCGIAFAFLDRSVAMDTPCAVEIRGKLEPGTVVNKRFFKRAG